MVNIPQLRAVSWHSALSLSIKTAISHGTTSPRALLLNCNQRPTIHNMHTCLSWQRVEERLNANVLHSQLTHSTDTHTSLARNFQSQGPEQTQGNVQYYTEQ
jgi:hypothetical protein